MANEVEIRVTAQDDTGPGLSSAEKGVKSLGDQAKKAGTSIKGLDDHLRRGSSSADSYASGIDRAGESADSAETRFTGLASGIDGVTTLMADPSPQEFAQGIADVSDGIANSAVPALKGMVDKLGGLKGVLIGGGIVAGVAALGVAIKQADDAANAKNLDEMAERLAATGSAVNTLNASMVYATALTGKLDEAFERQLALGPLAAENFIELAEATGVGSDKIEEMRERLDRTADAGDRAAESVNSLNDAFRAQSDPLFAAINAQTQLEEAQLRVTEATREYGSTSIEATSASIAAAEAAADYDSALLNLEAAVARGDISVSSMNATLARWVEQGRITQQSADVTASKFRGVGREARAIPGEVSTTLYANDRARPTIRSVEQAIEDLPRSRTITVNIVLNDPSGVKAAALAGRRASGGITGAAAGGVRDNMTLVGEQGPELVKLPVGSHVFPNPTSREMMRLIGGGMANGGPVRLGTVSQARWNQLLAMGWRGDPRDRMEALYSPAALAARGPIRQGQVSGDVWKRLMQMGWYGIAGDGMEALYAPSTRRRVLPAGRRVARPRGGPGGGGRATGDGEGEDGTRVVIELRGGDDMFTRWLRNRIAAGGGNVQAVLGQR